jgi:hypothetical protein
MSDATSFSQPSVISSRLTRPPSDASTLYGTDPGQPVMGSVIPDSFELGISPASTGPDNSSDFWPCARGYTRMLTSEWCSDRE